MPWRAANSSPCSQPPSRRAPGRQSASCRGGARTCRGRGPGKLTGCPA
uniref:Uncharacterized protein n=1 Tax=Arundo donax TaxID=35708 RepID=A0A0A8ZBK6_ARUDO